MAREGHFRSRDEVLGFFEGLELVNPGMVRVQEWRPASEIEAKSPAAGGAGWAQGQR